MLLFYLHEKRVYKAKLEQWAKYMLQILDEEFLISRAAGMTKILVGAEMTVLDVIWWWAKA